MPEPSSLALMPAGARATITAVPVEDATLAGELAALRLLPGERVEVVEVIPFGGPLLVQTAGGVYALSRRLAGRIAVVPAGAAEE